MNDWIPPLIAFALLFWVMHYAVKDSRIQEDRRDRLDRERRDELHRDRTDFGFDRVEHAANHRSLRRFIRQ